MVSSLLIWCSVTTGATVALSRHDDAQLHCAPHGVTCAVQLHDVLVQQYNYCTSGVTAEVMAPASRPAPSPRRSRPGTPDGAEHGRVETTPSDRGRLGQWRNDALDGATVHCAHGNSIPPLTQSWPCLTCAIFLLRSDRGNAPLAVAIRYGCGCMTPNRVWRRPIAQITPDHERAVQAHRLISVGTSAGEGVRPSWTKHLGLSSPASRIASQAPLSLSEAGATSPWLSSWPRGS